MKNVAQMEEKGRGDVDRSKVRRSFKRSLGGSMTLLPRPQLSAELGKLANHPPTLHVSQLAFRWFCRPTHRLCPTAHLPKWEGACEGRRIT